LAAADIIDEEIEQYKKELEERQQAQIDYAEAIEKSQDNIKKLRNDLQELNNNYDG
jgi:peptidoglycan hydrolase CwlO-like protein